MDETTPPAGSGPPFTHEPVFTATPLPAFHGMPPGASVVPPPRWRAPGSRWWVHAALFVATIASTWLLGGFVYSATLLAILTAHEMGHYLVARHYRVPVSLPYFVPLPLPPFGTMGAVIRMGHLGANRRQLFDIGAAGPLAGLVIALPACVVGISLSKIVPLDTLHRPDTLSLGSPLLFQWISDALKGPMPAGQDLVLHPMAFAAWAGLFVTALNLLPVGQLDGGHVLYALFDRPWSGRISLAVALAFVGLAIAHNMNYIVFALLAFLMRKHPPTWDDSLPITPARRVLGVLLLLLFVLCFTPQPFLG